MKSSKQRTTRLQPQEPTSEVMKASPIHARDGGWAGWRLCRLPGDDPGLSDTQPIELTATPLTGVLKPSARIISLDRSLGSHRDGSGTGAMSNCTYWAKTRRSRDLSLRYAPLRRYGPKRSAGHAFHIVPTFFLRMVYGVSGLNGLNAQERMRLACHPVCEIT